MKILYVALKESLPGYHGGAVHVLEVARQLARRGHSVTVVVQKRQGQREQEEMDGFRVQRLAVRSNLLLWQCERPIRSLIEAERPDVVMERYYNFAGAGVRAARAAGIGSLLEVNAPMMDPPGTTKARLDQGTGGWMTRLAREQARTARRIVTPLAATVPFAEARGKVREIPWGANVELFDRAALDAAETERVRRELEPGGRRVVAFMGSFRPWHGVREFAEMARQLAPLRPDILWLLIGAGELLEETRSGVERAGLSRQVVLTGAVPYERVPYYLSQADVGVAPFNTAVHPPLRAGFYWSPLKVHEYMAMELPVVAPNLAGLNQIARHGQEGWLYEENDAGGLRAAVLRLVDEPELARKLGRAARARVVEHFSWQKHAELLEHALQECLT